MEFFESLVLFLPAQMKNPRFIEMYFGSRAAISLPALKVVSIWHRNVGEGDPYGIEFSKMAEKTVEYTNAREIKAQAVRLPEVYRSPSINLSKNCSGFQMS